MAFLSIFFDFYRFVIFFIINLFFCFLYAGFLFDAIRPEAFVSRIFLIIFFPAYQVRLCLVMFADFIFVSVVAFKIICSGLNFFSNVF